MVLPQSVKSIILTPKFSPYLLSELIIDRPNQVWCADITFIRMLYGFIYLVAVMELVQSLYPGLGDLRHAGDSLLCPSFEKGF